MNVKDRVRKHRAQLKVQGCGRLEVSMSVALIDQLREVARLKGVPVCSAVQEALEPHLMEYRQLHAEGQRLRDERVRVLNLAGSSEYQSQAMEYNRQNAAHNERLGRFQGGNSP